MSIDETAGLEWSETSQSAKDRTVTAWRPWILGWLVSTLIVSILSYIFVMNSPLQLSDIEGTIRLDTANYCELDMSECAGGITPIKLPHFGQTFNQTEPVYGQYIFEFGHKPDGSLQSIYIPQSSDSLRVFVNHRKITDIISVGNLQTRDWFKPANYALPENLLAAGQNTIRIDVKGVGQEGTRLYPIYIGPSEILQKAYDRRYWVTRGAARLGFFMIAIATIGLGVLTLARRHDRAFLWLCLAGACATIMSSYFAFDSQVFSYRFSTIRFIFALQVFILFVIKFFFSFLNVNILWIERSYIAYLAFSFLFHLLSPESYIMTFAVWLTIGNFVWTYFGLAVVWVHRHLLSKKTFWIFYSTFVGASICGAHDWQYFLPNAPASDMPLLHFLPLFASIAALILVGSQMLSALKNTENFNQVLQARITDKTIELERSYAQLASTQKRQVIDQERQRIMMDLHDGVGGHLINTLAYMENNRLEDETLKTALETALTDLSLMVDSLQNQDSITTLLGMFRSRLEPLLTKHGLVFEWKIGDEPQMPVSGPSHNLTLLRIVQEAVTNSIKHAKATIITVATDESSVTISDNGKGFDFNPNNYKPTSGGVGFLSMKRRTEELEAELIINSHKNGTSVKLLWADKE